MSAPPDDPLAFRVADRLRSPAPWEVFAERLERFEVHVNGRAVEVVRGPLRVEGYGVRVFRRREDVTGTGFHASTDASPEGIARSVDEAERGSAYSTFPTKRVDLPTESPVSSPRPEVLDAALWASPLPRLEEYVASLMAPFDSLRDVVPSFGSARATLSETSIANSAGLRTSFSHTTVLLEVALKAFGGPEGAPEGEYWVNDQVRRLDPARAAKNVPQWAQFARDARSARGPPTGEQAVVLPPEVLAGIIPPVVGFHFSGASRLRQMAPEHGSEIAAPSVTIRDDGLIPWAPNSAPVDDEGTPTGRRAMIQSGVASELIYNLLHAGAFELPPTGNGLRGTGWGSRDWLRFTHDAGLAATTIDLAAGDGGADSELVEAAGDGVWVQQLGWANPDPISGTFGGEIRIGYRIRNGQLAEPLRGGTVGGIVLAPPGQRSLLAQVAALGSSTVLCDQFRGPSMLVRPLSVAGA